jgi:predicted metal-dependent phosphoesterase TrpH
MIIKADLHIHTSDDREDPFINYSAKDIINSAATKGIGVLALTHHRVILQPKKFAELKEYAKSRNILLISGVEAKIEGKHVLIYNITQSEHDKIKSFEDLRSLRKKNKNIFVIAPHPFMIKTPLTKNCLQEKYFQNKDLFDALEYQQFYSFFMNPNKKTQRIAKEDNKPLVANSDLHFIEYFGRNYTLIDVDGPLSERSVFRAIKSGKTKIVSNTNLVVFTGLLFKFLIHGFEKPSFRS